MSEVNFMVGGCWGYSEGNSRRALKNPPSLQRVLLGGRKGREEEEGGL